MLTPETAIIIPRWLLTAKYALFVALGAAVLWTTAPTFTAITGDAYTAWWSIALMAAATVSLIGSLRQRWEAVERWGVTVLASLIIAYALAPIALVFAGDRDRTAYSVIAFMVSLLPISRAVSLLRGVGRRRA